MGRKYKRRSNAISAFAIQPTTQTMGVDAWSSREPKAVWYGFPEKLEYPHPEGGTYLRCRVEAFQADEESLGYLPLPARYAQAWVQLCYTTVYWMSQWKAWVAELGRPPRVEGQPPEMVQACVNNNGARFLHYLVIRRLIIEELLQHQMSKDEDDELPLFDEYLIRERFNWLWTDFKDTPVSKREPLGLDPVDPQNKRMFDWTNASLGIPEEMNPPAPSPAQTWMWGHINHFDVQVVFDNDYPYVVKFQQNKSLQRQAECPYKGGRRGLPDRWHEAHKPAVRFLTADEDQHFNPQGVIAHPSPPPAEDVPSQAQEGSLGPPIGTAASKRKHVSPERTSPRKRDRAPAKKPGKAAGKRKDVRNEANIDATGQAPPAGPHVVAGPLKPVRPRRKCAKLPKPEYTRRRHIPGDAPIHAEEQPPPSGSNSQARPPEPHTNADIPGDVSLHANDKGASAGTGGADIPRDAARHTMDRLSSTGADGADVPGDAIAADAPCGIVDNEDTRAIVNALVMDSGGIALPQVHKGLQNLLGSQYDAELWGKLLDNVVSAPDEEPLMTIDEAFQFAALPDVGPDIYEKSMEEYRSITKGLL